MPTAKFIADFSSFENAVHKAEVELKSFETGAAKVEKQLDRMANSLNGRAIIQQATLMAEAVERVGGVTKLTEAELQRIGSVAQEAASKMRALGMNVPENIQKIADAAKAATPSVSQLGTAINSLGTQVVSTMAGFVSSQAVIGLVGGAFRGLKTFVLDSVAAYAETEAAQKKLTVAMQAQGTGTPQAVQGMIDLASQMQKTTVYSDDLLVSMQALLVQVGNVAPKDMAAALEAATNLASGLGIDLEQATTLVAKAATGHTAALGKMGITIDEAKVHAQGFSYVLDQLNAKFGGQAAAQMDTYAGRLENLKNRWGEVQESLGKVITQDPAIQAALRNLATAADEAATAADKSSTSTKGASSALVSFLRDVGVITLDQAAVIQFFEQWADGANKTAAALERLKAVDLKPAASHFQQFAPVPSHDSGAAEAAAKREADIVAAIADARAASVVKLTDVEKQRIAVLDSLNKSESFIATTLHLSEDAVKTYVEALKAAKKAHEDWDKANRDVNASLKTLPQIMDEIDGRTLVIIRDLLAHNAKVDEVAKAYGLYGYQVQAVADDLAFQKSVTDATDKAFGKLGTVTIPTLISQQQHLKFALANLTEDGLIPLADGFDVVTEKARLLEEQQKRNLMTASTLARQLAMGGTGASVILPKVVPTTDLQAANDQFDKLQLQAQTTLKVFTQLATIGGAQFGGLAQQILSMGAAWHAASAAVAEFGAGSMQAAQAGASLSASVTGLVVTGVGMLIDAYSSATAAQAALAAELFNFKVQAADAFNSATDALGGYSAALVDAVMNAKTLGDAQQALKNLNATTALATEASRKYGPSAQDYITQYKKAVDMFNLMRESGNYTAKQLEKAYADVEAARIRAEGHAPTKGKGAVTDAQREAAALQDLADQAAAAGYQTQKSLQESADQAARLYVYMRDSGQYTAEQIADAFDKAQKAHETALGRDSAAIDELKSKYKSLADSVAQEAPEEVMGVIETQMRGQMAALDAEIKAAQAASEKAINSTMDKTSEHTTDTFNDMGVRITDDLTAAAQDASKQMQAQFDGIVIHIPVIFDVQNSGALSYSGSPHVYKQAAGGDWFVTRPTMFLAGEAGPERATFTPAGKSGTTSPDVDSMTTALYALRRDLAQQNALLPKLLARAIRDELQVQ